jgi:hypothetical protein
LPRGFAPVDLLRHVNEAEIGGNDSAWPIGAIATKPSLERQKTLLHSSVTYYYDEMALKARKRRPRSVRSRGCKRRINVKARGRLPSYCSAMCKQRAYLMRKYRGPMESLAQDLATMRVRGILRQEIWAVLKECGLVSEPEPPPRPGPKRDQTGHLRLVEE